MDIETTEIDVNNAPANPVDALVMCDWSEEFSIDDDINYNTQCGETFYFQEGNPTENEVVFCCFCGKPIKTISYDGYPKINSAMSQALRENHKKVASN